LTKICWHLWTKKINKNPIKKSMAETIAGETKREGQRKAIRQTARRNQKKERASPSQGERQKKRSVRFQAARTRSQPPPTIPTMFKPTFVVGSNFSFTMQLAHTLLKEEKLMTVCYDLQDG
jgi:hypothetical protein